MEDSSYRISRYDIEIENTEIIKNYFGNAYNKENEYYYNYLQNYLIEYDIKKEIYNIYLLYDSDKIIDEGLESKIQKLKKTKTSIFISEKGINPKIFYWSLFLDFLISTLICSRSPFNIINIIMGILIVSTGHLILNLIIDYFMDKEKKKINELEFKKKSKNFIIENNIQLMKEDIDNLIVNKYLGGK